jgi:hypothetical protein
MSLKEPSHFSQLSVTGFCVIVFVVANAVEDFRQ